MNSNDHVQVATNDLVMTVKKPSQETINYIEHVTNIHTYSDKQKMKF